jgi:hypothetical protein
VADAAIIVTGSGVTYSPTRAVEDRLEPARPGEHVWTSIAAFRLTDASARAAMTGTGQIHLDMENLASLNVGCFVCEEPWSERISYRRCKGEPR